MTARASRSGPAAASVAGRMRTAAALAGAAALAALLALLPAGPAAAQSAPAPAAAPAVAEEPPPPAGVTRVHALSLLGPPALPRDFTHFPYVNPDAPKGGEVTLGAIGTFDSFNPFIIRGTAAAGVAALWEPLFKGSLDEASTEYPHLARYAEIPADRMWIAFALRPEARWHDGRPITSEDVVWTFDTLRQHGRPFYRAYWGDVERVVAEGPHRVVFHFKHANNRELAQIVGQMAVLPRHWWQGRDFTRPLLDAPLGSGPYRIESFEAGRTIVYRRVPGYWGARLPTERGTDNFDLIRYEYYRDTTVMFEAFKAGQIDFRAVNVAREWAVDYNFPAAQRGQVQRAEIPHQLPTGMQGFAMNLRRPAFQDRRVREALMQAFDFEWSNANLFHGAYTRTRSYFENSEFAATGLPQGEEKAILERFRGRIPDEVFTRVYAVPATDGSGNNRDNLRRALELLRAAGHAVREGRLVNTRTGQPFAFEILLSSPAFERVVLPYVQSLRRLGIEARVRTVDTAQYQRRMDQFDYDMTVEVFPQSSSPGNEQRDYWTCAKAREEGSRNTIGICDPAVDELVELVIAARDVDELRARVRALDRVLLWGHYVVPNWHTRAFRVAYWNKFGRPAANPRYGLPFDSWWIDPALAARLAAETGRAQ